MELIKKLIEVSKAIGNQARDIAGEEAASALGEQGADKAEKLGGSALRNLLGKPQQQEPASQ